MLLYLVASVAFWGALLAGAFYFARRHVRALEARAGNDADVLELRARVKVLEEALDDTRRDVDRLETAQEFTTRLLGARVEKDDRVR
jgi:hypothetical protein